MREPDITGTNGRAWKAAASSMSPELRAKWPAGLDLWLMHVPGAHPFWGWYILSGVSLRDIEGCPPAKRQSPDMTHEVILFALDPDYHPDDTWCSDGPGRWSRHFLTPANLVEQVTAFTDDHLIELLFLFSRACCHGQACPDTDFRSANQQLIHTTADHLRRGLHEAS